MTRCHFVNASETNHPRRLHDTCRKPTNLRNVAGRMPATTRVHFDAVLLGIPARLTAILLGLNLGAQRAVAQLVRTLNRLVHYRFFPGYGLFSTSPPIIWEAGLGA